MCMVPPKTVRVARRISVIGMATAAWSSGWTNPAMAVYLVDSQGRNSVAKMITPEVMATPPCTRMSAACSLFLSIN